MEEKRRVATWSSLSTFVRRYKLNSHVSANAAFVRRILQHVLSDEDKTLLFKITALGGPKKVLCLRGRTAHWLRTVKGPPPLR